ncbi:hypothetical protein AT959_11180 [Dechloromonas denitrificans]|uniref:Uncharacterized protein n=1 Tax=Dechloromonas denitrificans TaxID=281362 RepID=A0A133XG80_9RHOO|nr:hypothetical protein AT959_11180 [Dechloromonas denitrificans]
MIARLKSPAAGLKRKKLRGIKPTVNACGSERRILGFHIASPINKGLRYLHQNSVNEYLEILVRIQLENPFTRYV